ncbi:MAG TPA: hypothetical protein VFQ61_26765 [Polyangiaceae bacterium]|nr:hypothetical protein [Polyangiaceae bacterium]
MMPWSEESGPPSARGSALLENVAALRAAASEPVVSAEGLDHGTTGVTLVAPEAPTLEAPPPSRIVVEGQSTARDYGAASSDARASDAEAAPESETIQGLDRRDPAARREAN